MESKAIEVGMARIIALIFLILMFVVASSLKPAQELEKTQYINDRFKQLEEHHERNSQ